MQFSATQMIEAKLHMDAARNYIGMFSTRVSQRRDDEAFEALNDAIDAMTNARDMLIKVSNSVE